MKKNNKKGFTLVELVIVVAVMAVLVAVAIPTISSIKGTAETNVAASNAQTLESMLKLGEAEGNYELKTGVDVTKIEKYLNEEAKLGIDDGEFGYNMTTGICVSGSSGDLNIEYTDGVADVTTGTVEESTPGV